MTALFTRVVFVTSSEDKHREAQAVLGMPLERVNLDLPEPQGLDVGVIASAKARVAFERVCAPVIVEDTSLELAALGGFPGPLVRWLLAAAGAGAIPRMLDGFADRRATARCLAILWDGSREWRGEGVVAGEIAHAPTGTNGFGWDIVFQPEWGHGRTYAEMAADEKNTASHRALAFRDLARALGRGTP